MCYVTMYPLLNSTPPTFPLPPRIPPITPSSPPLADVVALVVEGPLVVGGAVTQLRVKSVESVVLGVFALVVEAEVLPFVVEGVVVPMGSVTGTVVEAVD